MRTQSQSRSRSSASEQEAEQATHAWRSSAPAARHTFHHDFSRVPIERRLSEQRVQRAPLPDGPMSTTASVDGELEVLLLEITSRTKFNRQTRQELDALPPTSSPEREALEKKLDAGRKALINALEKRVELLTNEIERLGAAVSESGMQSSAAHPESEEQFTKAAQYQKERKQHEEQLRQFKRWQTRERIKSIDEEVRALDDELAKLPPVSDPDNPDAELKATRRRDLEEERKTLAKSLTSTAVEYKQGDKRWGGIRYGDKPECSKIKEGGCGPATLAILLNYLYAEDPETLVEGPIEFVTPQETAKYAETHGRVCGHGTNGDTMITKLSTNWPGFRGRILKTPDQAADQVRGGNLVIFLCKKCTGQKVGGKGTRFYEGHFMVLNGVDEAGETFNVLDPGDRESNDIETITKTELKKHGAGYWIIEKK